MSSALNSFALNQYALNADGLVESFAYLQAVEGSDSFAASAAVLAQATLAAVETGDDTLDCSAKHVATGDLAATESVDSFSATCSVLVQAALDAAEGLDTARFVAIHIATGVLVANEAGYDTFAGVAQSIIHGNFAATESGADNFAATAESKDCRNPQPENRVALPARSYRIPIPDRYYSLALNARSYSVNIPDLRSLNG